MILRIPVTLRRPQSGRLEGRTLDPTRNPRYGPGSRLSPVRRRNSRRAVGAVRAVAGGAATGGRAPGSGGLGGGGSGGPIAGGAADQFGAALGDHDRRRVGVG
jgi:hypothetical protein